jgi:hypothetical protein
MLQKQINEFLKRVTYKPGWNFSVDVHPTGDFIFVINREAEDAYDPSKTVTLHSTQIVPVESLYYSEETWFGTIKQLILDTEFHELDEWLKFDGQMCHNPHVPDRIFL